MLKKFLSMLILLALCGVLPACAAQKQEPSRESASASAVVVAEDVAEESVVAESVVAEEGSLTLAIDGVSVPMTWEDNAAVAALRQKVTQGPLVVEMSPYGGFEQVGSLGGSYLADDAQITTSCGDVVLYNGRNIVAFYGSNTWAYTRLGKINLPSDQIAQLLNGEGITLTLSLL